MSGGVAKVLGEEHHRVIEELVGLELENGASIKDALKTVIETKLLGTWRLAVMMQEATKDIYVVTNCGGFYLG